MTVNPQNGGGPASSGDDREASNLPAKNDSPDSAGAQAEFNRRSHADPQQVPPGFDALNKPFLTCVWKQMNPDEELRENLVMIWDGMPVHEQLRGYYWEQFGIASDLIDACKRQGSKLPNCYILLDVHSGRPRGYGFVNTGNPHHFAFLSCLHAEYSQSRFAIMQPEGVEFEHENATKLIMPLGDAA